MVKATKFSCSDMNASPFRGDRARDKRFNVTVYLNSLVYMPNKYHRKPTFYHHNEHSVSQIDYIMHKEIHTHLEYKVENHDMDHLNVSDHSLVTATVPVVLKNTKTQFIIKKPNWSKCDKEKYRGPTYNTTVR